jgi:hypothetical protein
MTNFNDPSNEDMNLLFSVLRKYCSKDQSDYLEYLISFTDFSAYYADMNHMKNFNTKIKDSKLIMSLTFDEFFEKLQNESDESQKMIIQFMIDDVRNEYTYE